VSGRNAAISTRSTGHRRGHSRGGGKEAIRVFFNSCAQVPKDNGFSGYVSGMGLEQE